MVLSTPAEKNHFERLPRAPEGTDRAAAWNHVSGWGCRVDSLTFCQTVLVRIYMLEKVHTIYKHNYEYSPQRSKGYDIVTR